MIGQKEEVFCLDCHLNCIEVAWFDISRNNAFFGKNRHLFPKNRHAPTSFSAVFWSRLRKSRWFRLTFKARGSACHYSYFQIADG